MMFPLNRLTREILKDDLAEFSKDGTLAYVQSYLTPPHFYCYKYFEGKGFMNMGLTYSEESAKNWLEGEDVELLT